MIDTNGTQLFFSKLKKLTDDKDKNFEVFLLLVMFAISMVWVVEEKLGITLFYDRVGWLLTLIVLLTSFCFSFFAKKTHVVRIFVFIYLAAYMFFLTVMAFMQAVSLNTIYPVASTLQWIPPIYIVLFLFLTNKQAIWGAVGIYSLMLILLLIANADIFEFENADLQGLLLNTVLSQGVYIFCLFGVIKLKRSIDATELRAEKMEKMANIDGLLGIGNRRMLQHQLNTLVTENTPFSLLLIDIDRFKAINDTYGHLVGDDVLREMTQNIQSSLRQQDSIGRWGGEEFLVIANNSELKSAEILAQRIRAGVAQHQFSDIGRVTVSIGVTQFEPNTSVSHTFSIVDKALYEAKHAGRNRVVVTAL